MNKLILSYFGYKFWMGFNSFVILLLAVNIGTIGVEMDSGFPFLLALFYMIFMSFYLSKAAFWKIYALIGIGTAGLIFYLIGNLSGMTPDNVRSLAGAHILLSFILTSGGVVHYLTYRREA